MILTVFDYEVVWTFETSGTERYALNDGALRTYYRLHDGRWVYNRDDEDVARLVSQASALHNILSAYLSQDFLKELLKKEWFIKLRIDETASVTANKLPVPKDNSRQDRARGLLADDPEMSNADLAKRLGVNKSTVGRWKWLSDFRALLRDNYDKFPQGYRTGNGDVEAWKGHMTPKEVADYEAGRMK